MGRLIDTDELISIAEKEMDKEFILRLQNIISQTQTAFKLNETINRIKSYRNIEASTCGSTGKITAHSNCLSIIREFDKRVDKDE